MNVRTAASFVAAAALLAAAPGPVPTRAADGSEDIDSLRKRLRELEEQVAAFKKRLAELELRQSRDIPLAIPRLVVPGDGEVPPNWQPREYNGLRYYAIPLDQQIK